MTLSDSPQLKYQIRSGSRILSEAFTSRVAADLAFNQLSEDEKATATIVPITDNGTQYLIG